MKKLIWILTLLLVVPALAQEADPGNTVFQPLDVSNVRLRLSGDEGIALVFNANPTICEDLLIDIAVDSQAITVNAFAPPSDSVCNTFAPYEPVIPLPEIATEQAYLLYLNNFTSTFFLTETGSDSSTEAFAVLWGQDNFLVPFDAVNSMIDRVEFDGTTLSWSGNHPDGCETPVSNRLVQDTVESTLYHLRTFRLLPQGVMCPAQIVEFESTMDVNLQDGDSLEIAENYFTVADGELVPSNRIELTVSSVEILSGANGVIVAVTGTQDCGFETDSSVLERRFMTAIAIVAYESTDTPCGDLTEPYDDAFLVDSLPVIINGVAYDENGEIDPEARPQSNNNPPEGNQMVVDTVIESVEVAILESFPMQLQLAVSGYQPDGCDFPVEVMQSVDGNTVTLHIFRNVPADVMCTMNLVPYEETIVIDGEFTEGTVTIQVNDFTSSVDL